MTIKAILRDGHIQPVERLPSDWVDGQELIVEEPGASDLDEQPYEQWSATFKSWLAELEKRRYPPGFAVDDSRDSIYEGRGE